MEDLHNKLSKLKDPVKVENVLTNELKKLKPSTTMT